MAQGFIASWMNRYNRFYRFITHHADSSKARLGLYLFSALESIIIPIPTDPLLAVCVLARPKSWIKIAGLTALASVIGGGIGWAIGAGLSSSLEALFAALPASIAGPEKFQQVSDAYQRLGLLLVLVGAFTPLPYKVIAVSAGLFGYGLVPFLLLSVIGRTARFMIVAGMARWHRNPRRLILLLSLLLVAFGAGFYLLR
jgi:membrane protein YqaA with SNARE-associated domain